MLMQLGKCEVNARLRTVACSEKQDRDLRDQVVTGEDDDPGEHAFRLATGTANITGTGDSASMTNPRIV